MRRRQDRGVFSSVRTAARCSSTKIGELDVAAAQPKLCACARCRSEVTPLGGHRTVRVDVRVVASTTRNLDQEIQVGRFREDLFHRLVVTRLELPPLRKRFGDIELLAQHFVRELGGIATIPPQLLSRWLDYAWPGNVRELKNAVARALTIRRLGSLAEGRAAEVPLDEATALVRWADASRGKRACRSPLDGSAPVNVFDSDLPREDPSPSMAATSRAPLLRPVSSVVTSKCCRAKHRA
jgi:DNA-binding NtrC family response regulator